MTDQEITPEHKQQLQTAKQALENAGIAMQIADVVGTPIEKAIKLLPKDWQEGVLRVSRDALDKAAETAIWTINSRAPSPSSDLLHKIAVTVSGVAAGAFGLPALAIELPISTTIMLRSIADVARSEGEDILMPSTKIACVEVFALGGRATNDDAAESGYYAARAALGKVVTEATAYLAKGGSKASTPAMVAFITHIAARFHIQVTEKAAAQALPIVGAAGGALINNLFISHFQSTARAHFTVRRLERIYSTERVEAEYIDI